VHPDVTYVLARSEQGTFVVAEPLLAAVLGEDAETVATVSGTELASLRYQRPFDLVDIPDAHVVKRLEPLAAAGEVVDVSVEPNFRALGKRFGKQTQQVAGAVLATDPRELVGQLRVQGQAKITFDGAPLTLDPDEVVVSEVPRSGWVVESQRGVTIALDTEITPALAAEGIARDVVRVAQQARRDAGLDVSDRITLSIAAPGEVLAAVRTHQDFVANETLAESVILLDSLNGGFPGTVGDGVPITASVTKRRSIASA
jgi:isoleucyl-tRNA synthetase